MEFTIPLAVVANLGKLGLWIWKWGNGGGRASCALVCKNCYWDIDATWWPTSSLILAGSCFSGRVPIFFFFFLRRHGEISSLPLPPWCPLICAVFQDSSTWKSLCVLVGTHFSPKSEGKSLHKDCIPYFQLCITVFFPFRRIRASLCFQFVYLIGSPIQS